MTTLPDGAPLDPVAATDISQRLAPGRVRVQSLHGFDDDYTDIVDYIVKCTHKIWEEGAVGLIYTHYAHNVSIWTTSGLTYGREAIVESTLHSLAAFPNRRLFADAVIWSGDDTAGFHTSHRYTSVLKHTGHSWLGAPTGKWAVHSGIANCFVKENRIIEEWVAGDELGLTLQLGLDERAVVEKLLGGERREGATPREYSLPERGVGQAAPAVYPPRSAGGFDVEDFVRRSLHEIWNWRLLNRIADVCAPDYICHTTRGRHLRGAAAYKAFVLSLLGAFSDAALTVEHFYALGDEASGYRTMTRWNLQGTHKGAGPYGDPTGQPFYLLGISHHTLKDGRFVEEWTYFDEVALLAQLCRQAG
ncbi:MAG: ester cyclase [Anaerolineales bacterium]|nr:ester cyclase [Anaerolineales bacterium]